MKRTSLCLFIFLGLNLIYSDTLLLTLDKAINLALANNRLIAQTKEKVKEAMAGKGIALGALLPQMTLSGTYYRLDRVSKFSMVFPRYENFPLPVIDPTTGETIGFTPPIPMIVGADTFGMELGVRNNYLLRGTIQQTLFTWGKLYNVYRIAGLSLDMEKENLRATEGAVKVSVVETFYQTFLAQKTLELLNESKEQLQRHWERVKRLYDKGLASRLDLLRTEVKLAEIEASVLRMENNFQLALKSLLLSLGLDLETPVLLSVELDSTPARIELESAQKTALAKRPESKQLRAALKVAHLGKEIALTSNLPTLFSQLNYDYKKPVGLENKWGTDWNVTLGFQMPLFTGFSNYNKIKQAQARERQAKIALTILEEGIKLEVTSLVNTLNQEIENIALQKKNLRLAEEAFSLAGKSYEAGLVTNLEYLDSQISFLSSQISYWSSLANYQIVLTKLKKAMGEF